jgi:threonine/homoserine/homoserine lactone efflux protein
MTELPMSLEFYLAYVLACVVIVIVPGPTVSLIVANSVTHGTRAGLINIAGTQLGLAVMIGIVLVGLASLISTMGVWFARPVRWAIRPEYRRRAWGFSGRAFWC